MLRSTYDVRVVVKPAEARSHLSVTLTATTLLKMSADRPEASDIKRFLPTNECQRRGDDIPIYSVIFFNGLRGLRYYDYCVSIKSINPQLPVSD